MLNNPHLALEDALGRHQERITAAQRQRLVTEVRRAGKEQTALASRQQQESTAPYDGPNQSRPDADLADWLIVVGDIVAHYPTAELDGDRQLALGVFVGELLSAARDAKAGVPYNVGIDDSAVVLLRTLGRLAASTTGESVPVSRRRARKLQTAVDDLVDGHQAQPTQSPAETTHDTNPDRTRSAALTAAIQLALDRRTWARARSSRTSTT